MCTSESDVVLCGRLRLNCGTVSVVDACGASRALSCGICSVGSTCGGDGQTNVCSTPCMPETDTAFCARLGASCGEATQFDNCGVARTVASCGTCTAGACETASACVNNACAGIPKSDGTSCGVGTTLEFCRSGQCAMAKSFCDVAPQQGFTYATPARTTFGNGPCSCATATSLHFEYSSGTAQAPENDTCTACAALGSRAVCF
jgi:hypothetical protein